MTSNPYRTAGEPAPTLEERIEAARIKWIDAAEVYHAARRELEALLEQKHRGSRDH